MESLAKVSTSVKKSRFAIALLLVLSGVLQTLSLAPFDWWPLGVLSFSLMLWVTQALNPDISISTKQSIWYGWLIGLGLFGSGASWVYVSIHVYGYAPPLLAGFLTASFVSGLALFHTLFFYLFIKLRRTSLLGNGLAFSALWVLGDAFRSVFLTGFPWLFVGYSHLDSPLSGWVPILGVYGMTLLTALSGLTIYFLLTRNARNIKIAMTIPVILLWVSSLMLNQISWTTPAEQSNKSVALLQLNIPQELKWHPAQRSKTLALLEELSQENWDKDIIVWPETAVPVLLDRALPFLQKVGDQAKEHNTSIISGIPYREFNEDRSQTLHNSIVSFGEGKGIYHKQKLVPFGEYVPLQQWLRGLIAFFDLPMSDFRKGPAQQSLLSAETSSVSPFICYEVVYPDFVNSRAANADLLLTISNDSWFGTSIGPLQHLQMAQMRAAEQGRYMIRATNNGVSAIIDERGKIKAQSEQFVQTTLSSEVQVFQGRTPFSHFGSYPIFLLCLLACLIIAFARRNRP